MSESSDTQAISRIFHLAGPADITGDYDTWIKKDLDATSFGGGVFIEQFFQFCKERGTRAYLISTASGLSSCNGQFILEYRNPNTRQLKGIRYHLRMLRFMSGVIITIARFRPNILLITMGDHYLFLLYVLYFTKMAIVPFLHCTLWPRMKKHSELTIARRMLLRLTGQFLRSRSEGVLAISDVISSQLNDITSRRPPRTVRFRPIYERGLFQNMSPPVWDSSPFRVLFVGRVTTDKGIHTLLDVARLVRVQPSSNTIFDVCGTGDEFDAVQSTIAHEHLTEIQLHGHCSREQLHSLYSRCHAVIIPTTANFPEGFNRVSIEAVLCGRPSIVSTAALEPEIASAVIEVSPNDIKGFADAIKSLRENRDVYERLRLNALRLQDLFYDKTRGWEVGLLSIIKAQATSS